MAKESRVMTPHGHGWSCFLGALLLFFTSLSGCRNQCETVEMALRARELDVRLLKEEVLRLSAYNDALLRELHAVRHQTGWPGQGGPAVTPEYASQTYTLKRITLGRGTSGIDEDQKTGDEALQVVIEPRDMADDIIKAPGAAQVTALEVSTEGLKTPLSQWNISAEEIRKNWRQGLFSNGYVLTLPWQQQPKSKQVRIVVRFHLSDGRVFEADRDIVINTGPMVLPAPRPSSVTEPTWPGPELPPPKELIPAPKQPPVMPPANPVGPSLNSTSHWQAPRLSDAVKMLRPEPLYGSPP